MKNNSKLKVKPIFLLAVTALILLVTAVSTVTYAWIETGNNLVIKTDSGNENAANVSVINRAGYARNMAKNNTDRIIQLNDYVDYSNLYFAPAKGEMLNSSGAVTENVDEAKDVKISINGAGGNREVNPEDISTNYIDFEIKIKNNDKTHSDIKFANSDTDRVITVDGKTAKFGVAVIAKNAQGSNVIFTDSDKLKKETPAIETLYPGEEVTLRVKIWLESSYKEFTSTADGKDIAGKPVKVNLALVMTDPKTTTFKVSDRTNSFEEEQLLKLSSANGYKLFAVNSKNIVDGEYLEKFPLTYESVDNGVATFSGMPEFLLYGDCTEADGTHKHDDGDDFELWAYEGGDTTTEPKKWHPGTKPEVTGDNTDVYTIYGDLIVRNKEITKLNGFLRGTWKEVVAIELRDHSIERIFTDESVRIVSFFNREISYPMYRVTTLNENTGEQEPTNVLRTIMPKVNFTASNGGTFEDDFYFNSRFTDNCDTTANMYGTLRLSKNKDDYETAKVVENGLTKYVYAAFGFSGVHSDDEDYCTGAWYSGEVDKIRLQDATTGRRVLQHYTNNPTEEVRVSYKGDCTSAGDGMNATYYLAHYDKESQSWYSVVPSEINPSSTDAANKSKVQFRIKYSDQENYYFIAPNRVKTGNEYVYSFINELSKDSSGNDSPLGSWTYNLADDTVIYVAYNDDENDTSTGHSGLFVEQTKVVPASDNTNWMPLGNWNTDGNRNYGIFENGNTEYRVFYINKFDFNIGTDETLYGEEFKMKPHTNEKSAFTSSDYPLTNNNGDIVQTTDGKPLYVGGRYRIDADKTVTELASFGYVIPQQTVVADVNEICSLPAAVDFKDPNTNITYSYSLFVGSGVTTANVTQLGISQNVADYGQLTFQANKAGEYTVEVTASATDGASVKTAIKKFIFKVGLNPRITIADNPNIGMARFTYIDENGNTRKLVNGASAKIVQGTVLTGTKPTIENTPRNMLEFESYKVVDPADPTQLLEGHEVTADYKYTVGYVPAVIDVKFKDVEYNNNYIIAGDSGSFKGKGNKGDEITLGGWENNPDCIYMSYNSTTNTVYADITAAKDMSSASQKIKIIKGDINKRNDTSYCVNYANPKVICTVPGISAIINSENNYKDLEMMGLKVGDKIRVEYDCTNNIISIKKALESIDIKLFAVPEFEKAQLSVSAKGTDTALIRAGKNDATGTAYEGTDVTLEQLVNNADFNSYSVDYFTVVTKSEGNTVGDIQTVYPGGKFTMPTKETADTVEITTHIKQDSTPFYIAGSADNVSWTATKAPMTVTDNIVTGYVTVDNIINGECFIRIAKGSSEQTAFQQVNTSVTMSKAGRKNVYVEADGEFIASHDQQSIKVNLPGMVKQTFKVIYDLGNHRITISTPTYFKESSADMSVTKDVETNLVLGTLFPTSVTASYKTYCREMPSGATVAIGQEATATPTFKSDTEEKHTVVTIATATIDGVTCYTSKTFNINVNDLVDVTIKKHSLFDISGVKVTATYEGTTYTPSADDVTFRAVAEDTVKLTLKIPNSKFNGFHETATNNFTIIGINKETGQTSPVTPTFTTADDYTVATFKVPSGGATVTPNPTQHDSMTYYLTGDPNAVDGVSWSEADGYNKTFEYDSVTDENGNKTYLNTITYKDVVLTGNKIANIKISRDGYKANPAAPGRDDKKTSVSYTENMKFDWAGAPLSVSNVAVTNDDYNDIRIEGVFNANNPKRVNLTYYLAEHKLVITDSENTGAIMTEDLLAVLRNQKVMFYFGIKDESAGYLNEAGQMGKNHYSFLASMSYDNVSYNYAPVCLPSKTYYIAQSSDWTGKSIGEAANAGKAYLLKMENYTDTLTPVNGTSGCTVPTTSFSVNLTNQSSIDTGVTLNSSTSVTGAPNSLSYYITKTPTDASGDIYPEINGTTEFMPFDPNNLKQLENGNYIVVPVVGDGSIHVRGADIKLKITDKTIKKVNVTVENNNHAIVKAVCGDVTINENEEQPKTLNADDEVTITAQIENATFNSFTRVESFDIVNTKTGAVIETVTANNNSAVFTVPEYDITIKANLVQLDSLNYYITGENIDGISRWTSTDSDNMLFAFDKENNLFTKEIKLTGNTVQFKIAKNSSALRDDPKYSISEADPRPEFTSSVVGLTADYATSEYDGKTVYNFQLTGDAISGTTVKLTYDPSANTLTVSQPDSKPTQTVTITPVDHATVTATYTKADGTTETIGESENGTPIPVGTELTLSCVIENPDFNSYKFASYTVTGAELSSSKFTVGENPVTVTTGLGRDITSDNAKFYLTGTNVKSGTNELNWGSTYAEMTYVDGTNTVSIPVTVLYDAQNVNQAKVKISKGGYTNAYRDEPDTSVTLYKEGRGTDGNVSIVNNASDVVTDTLETSKEAKDRCLYLTAKNNNRNIKLTYDLDTHTITIDKVETVENPIVTLKPVSKSEGDTNDYSKCNAKVSATYTASGASGTTTVTPVTEQISFTDIDSDVVFTAAWDNPNFNSYRFVKYIVTEGTSVSEKTTSTFTLTKPTQDVTVEPVFERVDPKLKLVSKASSTATTWTSAVDPLTYDATTNTVTGRYDFTTGGNKYLTVSNGSRTITLTDTDFTGVENYAEYDSTTKSVLAKLPNGATTQSLKFTYNLGTNKLTVEAPVKFSDLTDSTISDLIVNTAVTLKSTATKETGFDGTITYKTECTSDNSANVTIGNDTSATPTFKATASDTYTVTTTATLGDYKAVKTYTITANPASTKTVYATGPAVIANSAWGKWTELSSSTSDGKVIYTAINLGSKFKVSNKTDYNSYTDPDISVDNSLGDVTISGTSDASGTLGTADLSTLGSGKAYLCCQVSTGKIYVSSTEPTSGGEVTTTRKVTVNAVGNAVVTATPTSGTAIAEGNSANVDTGTVLTLKADLSCKSVFYPYSTVNFVVKSGSTTLETVTTNSGTFTVPDGTGDITIDTQLTFTNPSIYICGNSNIDGLADDWKTAIKMDWSDTNPTVVSKEITLKTTDAQFKLVKNSAANRDTEDMLVARTDSQIGTVLSGYTLSCTGGDHNNFKLSGSTPKKLLLTYDLATDKVSISEVATVQKVNVTVKSYADYSTNGISVKATYNDGSAQTINQNVTVQLDAATVLTTLEAIIPNSTFNSYKLNNFTVTEKDGETTVATQTVSLTGGVGTYTLPASGVTDVEITANITRADPGLKFASKVGSNGEWSTGTQTLEYSEGTNTVTGAFTVENNNTYITVQKGTAKASLESATEIADYASFDSTSKAVLATLPTGSTKQTVRFTYSLKDNTITVDAPVKFAETTASVTGVTAGTAKTDIDVAVTNTTTGTIAYTSAVETKPNGAADPTISFTGKKMSFEAATAGDYTVVVTATATVGTTSYAATKTYNITVDAAASVVFKQGSKLYFDFTGINNFTGANIFDDSNYYSNAKGNVIEFTLQSDFDPSTSTANLVKAAFDGQNWTWMANDTSKLPTSGQNCIKVKDDKTYEWTTYGSGSETTKKTIYLKNTANWNTPMVHVWYDSTPLYEWKANESKMTLVSGNIWKYEISDSSNIYKKVKFHNNGSSESSEFNLYDGYVYDNNTKTWEKYSGGESTTKTITLSITGDVLSADNTAKPNYRAVFTVGTNETSQFLNYSSTNSYAFTVPDSATKVKFERVDPGNPNNNWGTWGTVDIDSTKTTFKITGWNGAYVWA